MATKKKENVVPEIIDNVEALEAKMKAMREAQKKFATYTQEQVDKIFFEAAMAANKMRIPLAKMAVEETGRGLVEDKIIKNHYAAEYIYNKYKNDKTCGVIEEDNSYGIKKIAEPVGLVAAAAIVAFFVYMLVRPYKESETLSVDTKNLVKSK